ncbi:NACHT domain-containing protein [Streptomyces adelaidensis]|uniref:NACHT domain-containing protein n=1 Tax=Streptomyces adelaidensis TaxID=2796465 RepID=UPI001908B9F2|nr:NACHT domain-containing protein [Streptomyces adelaidensis]
MIHKLVLKFPPLQPPAWEDRLSDAAAQLAGHSQRNGTEQERRRGVCTPPPIQVRFTAAPEDLVAQSANILGTELGAAAPEPLDLDGRLADIADVYRRTSGRLVILGERGAGKSVVAQRLALELLDSRRPGQDPVPVVFGLHRWDPATELRDWLTACLQHDYNGLDLTGASGVSLAQDLIDNGYILPVLDGFDEISPGWHKDALRQLSATTMPLVLTSTTDAYTRTVRGGRTLSRAAAIVLAPLTWDDLRLYLPRTAHTTSSADEWNSTLAPLSPSDDDLMANPSGQALSTPLMVGLARSIYSDGPRNPRELLDTEKFSTVSAVQTHLLDQFVPAVYEGQCPWSAQNARRWLGYLAQRPARSDIAWWSLADSVPRSQRLIALALPAALLGAVTGRFAFGTTGGIAGGALLLLLGALIGWSRSPVPARMALRVSGRARHVLDQLVVGPIGGLTVGLMGYPMVRQWGWLTLALAGGAASALGGLLTGWARQRDPEADVKPLWKETGLGLVGGTAGGLTVGVVCLLARVPKPTDAYGLWLILGCVLGLAFSLGAAVLAPIRVETVVTPRALLQANRRYALFQACSVAPAYGLVSGMLTDPVNGLVLGPAVGLAFGIGAHAWGRWLIVVRFWLPLTGRLPWAVWDFLDDAHQRGVLRQAGATHEFRHARLQDNLAEHYVESRGSRFWSD